ncbi:hypothetical protein [Rhodococcus sp. P1Y]|uniref:hypothetical protein n=1 Tax=Rhodococcus sp. P1Y TaxID=1302308 RepID=UPI000EACA1EA|nr:hypothetical protein [Rhodococcus sp. P1Y]AYJ48998.1 hypothetical protein D8W71_12355 [Rhodococcus sp. P1Y]
MDATVASQRTDHIRSTAITLTLKTVKLLQHKRTEQATTMIIRTTMQLALTATVGMVVAVGAALSLTLYALAWVARFLYSVHGGVFGLGGMHFEWLVNVGWITSDTTQSLFSKTWNTTGQATEIVVAALFRGLTAALTPATV